MLEDALRLLTDYEPTISSLVGLLTLCAAIWGVFRLRVLSTRREARDGAPSGVSPRGAASSGWRGLFSLGLTEHSKLEELLAVRTVNVVLFCLLMVSLPWLLVGLLIIQSATLTAVNLLLFTSVLLGFALQRAGATGAARWLVIVVSAIYWLSLMLAVGPEHGLEYFLAGLVILPVLVLSRAQTGQRLISIAFIGFVFVTAVITTRSRVVESPMDESMLAIGYHANAVALAVIIFASLRYYKRFAATSYQLLSAKKRKNDALVSRLLPSDLADNMVNAEANAARWHADGTVLVGALTGFSKLYARMPAIDLVARLDALYSKFDDLIERNGLEKVKTLGTSYVAAAGVRESDGGYGSVAETALTMRETVEQFAREENLPIGFRCGLATGLTISGVIGKSRPRFDIWGEALDAAASLEAAAADGEILANETAYWRLKDRFGLVFNDTPSGSYRLVTASSDDELAS